MQLRVPEDAAIAGVQRKELARLSRCDNLLPHSCEVARAVRAVRCARLKTLQRGAVVTRGQTDLALQTWDGVSVMSRGCAHMCRDSIAPHLENEEVEFRVRSEREGRAGGRRGRVARGGQWHNRHVTHARQRLVARP